MTPKIQKDINDLKASVARLRSDGLRRHFTLEIRQRVVGLLARGVSPRALADGIGVSKNSIYAWRDEVSPERRDKVTGVSPRVFAVSDAVESAVVRQEHPQALRLQVGVFEVTVALREGAR